MIDTLPVFDMQIPSLQLDPTTVREWVSFFFLTIGGTIALRTYVVNQRQRRLENSFKLINFFKESLHENDVEEWRKIFYAAWKPSGVRYGHYFSEESEEKPLSDLFDLAPPDNGAVARMAEQFELLSQEILMGTVNLRLVYFELGHFMNSIYQWLKSSDSSEQGNSFIEGRFPNFAKMYKKNGRKFEKWAYKIHAHTC